MWKLGKVLLGAIKGSPKILPKIASLTSRFGRTNAFRSAAQLATGSGKKTLANRVTAFALQTAATSAILSVLDDKNTATDDEKLAYLKDSLKEEIPGIATCQSLEEALDLIKCVSIQNGIEGIDSEVIENLFQEAAGLVRNISRVARSAQPTRTFVSTHIKEQAMIDSYSTSLKSVLYLIGYVLSVLEADDMLGSSTDLSFIDYLLFGFSKAKSGVSWDNAVFSTPVRDTDIDHVLAPIPAGDLVKLHNELQNDSALSENGRNVVLALIESLY